MHFKYTGTGYRNSQSGISMYKQRESHMRDDSEVRSLHGFNNKWKSKFLSYQTFRFSDRPTSRQIQRFHTMQACCQRYTCHNRGHQRIYQCQGQQYRRSRHTYDVYRWSDWDGDSVRRSFSNIFLLSGIHQAQAPAFVRIKKRTYRVALQDMRIRIWRRWTSRRLHMPCLQTSGIRFWEGRDYR